MNMDMLIALGSFVAAFLIFRLIGYYLDKILNMGILDTVGFYIGIILIVLLLIKKDFLFPGTPLMTGLIIGFIVSLLWGVKETGFTGEILRIIISFPFFLWAFGVISGILLDDGIMEFWNRHIISKMPDFKWVLIVFALILFLFGTFLVLFTEFYLDRFSKNKGFTLVKGVSAWEKIFTQICGFIIIVICSGLHSEIISFLF